MIASWDCHQSPLTPSPAATPRSPLIIVTAPSSTLAESNLFPSQQEGNTVVRYHCTIQSERITPALMELHWLPMKARIIYKICLLTYKALKFGEPKYLYEYLVPFELETSVTVRHGSDRHRLFEPRTSHCSGERSFQHSAPRLYNKLPVEIKDSENINQFKKTLKTYLFGESYDMNQKTINEQ